MIGLGRRSVPQGISAKTNNNFIEKSKFPAKQFANTNRLIFSKDFDTNGWATCGQKNGKLFEPKVRHLRYVDLMSVFFWTLGGP